MINGYGGDVLGAATAKEGEQSEAAKEGGGWFRNDISIQGEIVEA